MLVRLFEYLNGKEPEPVSMAAFTALGEAPPVPTTSILTRTDGVVHWRGSVQYPDLGHEQTENIEVHASHVGLGVNPSVMIALADRLAQPEGEWTPFKPRLQPALDVPATQTALNLRARTACAVPRRCSARAGRGNRAGS